MSSSDQSKTLTFRVQMDHMVRITENQLFRIRVALREGYPDEDWSEDEAVINAIVTDFICGGAYSEHVMGPWVTVNRMLEQPKHHRG